MEHRDLIVIIIGKLLEERSFIEEERKT